MVWNDGYFDITTDVVFFLFIFCKIAKFGGYILCEEEYNSLFSYIIYSYMTFFIELQR
jgi:hypothetical protein